MGNLSLQPPGKLALAAAEEDNFSTSVYGSRFAAQDLPKLDMPESEMPRDIAYRLIKDDLSLDGAPTLNLVCYALCPPSRPVSELTETLCRPPSSPPTWKTKLRSS